MNRFIPCAAGCVALVCLRHAYASTYQSPAQAQGAAVVAVEGLKAEYGSCTVADFFVRNLRQERVDVEVYVEDLKDGSWAATWCQYNVLDPGGRLVKRFRPGAIEPGGRIPVRYDRCADYALCMKPKFPQASRAALQQMQQREDAQAAGRVMQRIAIDAYVGRGASLKDMGRWRSQPFARTSPAIESKSPR